LLTHTHTHTRTHTHTHDCRVVRQLEQLGGFNVVTPTEFVEQFVKNVAPPPKSCPDAYGTIYTLRILASRTHTYTHTHIHTHVHTYILLSPL
jgi:hypothetical protein